ncbi:MULTISPECIES: hypothetical protein [Rhizobium/Agrobacterium group]|uniref:Secreted protein n=1 Tax=Rhizobium soli TaxID=424798 RepID=A0A7X0JLV1_9HYPH|nr:MULTISPECIES: hypothetical protein [Rhizobium/Agrobacterium group]RYE69284.1 MAG: hypothetical protein EOP17_03900 [Rhizobiaceae bacterium]MBB6510006.1 hypothetical protein [Rhizobium soli]MBD8653462.1 hypothetical protein [Rhizobium sp. CFBP 13726]MBD8665374.1 hypothetical protein [Rhizobium sp. CFBP 8752]NSY19266.1 hypothetical protein [Neorhizobium sp. AL 9.2.2]
MKNFIIAAAIAITSTVSFVPFAQAQSVTIVTDDRRGPPPPRMMRERDRHHQRRGCVVKKVKTMRHGAVIIKETKVCR